MNSSSEITTSGGFANHTGNALETFVFNHLVRKGYTEFPNHKKQIFTNRQSIGGKQFSAQVPVGTTIYETERRADFMVFNKELFPDDLIIECKWQQSAGSVDEKYPFLVYNIIKTGVPTVVLLDGGGYKPAAMEWLKSMAGRDRALIGVYTMSEFQTRINNGFLG